MPRIPAKKSVKKESTRPSARVSKAAKPVISEAPVRMDMPEETLSAPDTIDTIAITPESPDMTDESAATDERMAVAGGRDRYFEAVGRRKTASARARLFTKAGDFSVNGKPYGVYFPSPELQRIAEDALKKMKLSERFRVSIKVSGGGSHSQAEATRHALARCLIKFNPDFRKRLKRAGFLKRDPRAKERKKFGLKKARRAPQWQKR